MRFLLAVLIVTAFAGCLNNDTVVDSDGDGMDGEEGIMEAQAPDDFSAEGSFAAGGDPFNFVVGEPCSQQASACEFVEFSTPITTNAAATLSWGLAANDLDLYLYTADGNVVSQEGINNVGDTPTNQHVMPPTAIGPGDYVYYVVAWSAAAESWTLDVTFS